jgi:transcriptional regulator GlxA family with amidase domain
MAAAPALPDTATIAAAVRPLSPPANRAINVAFVVGRESNLIDIAGPAEVFQDTWAGATLQQTLAETTTPFLNRPRMPFAVYLVGDDTAPFSVGPRLQMVPNFTLVDAPAPDVIVVGAQSAPSAAKLSWIRSHAQTAALTMSVCTGAFVVAEAGLFDGLQATTHHSFYDRFARAYPKVELVRGSRFVDNGRVASAGGLTSGIDLALHVVARYFGEAVADETANWMEFSRMTSRPVTTPS